MIKSQQDLELLALMSPMQQQLNIINLMCKMAADMLKQVRQNDIDRWSRENKKIDQDFRYKFATMIRTS